MTLIKEVKLGKTQIEFYLDNEPTLGQIRERLINVYDTINKIAESAEKRGIDTSKWFYTEEQIDTIKNNNPELFI